MNDCLSYEKELIAYLETLGIVKLNEPLNRYTTFKCGGPADILIYPHNRSCIPKIYAASRESDLPFTVIGGGSNLLIGDNGIKGIVMRLSDDCLINSTISLEDDIIYSDSSISKEDFMNFSVEAGFEGFEFMAGIPGTLGGGIMMNAGTDMGTFIDILHSVDIVNGSGEIKRVEVDRDMSSYRKFDIGDNTIITGGCFMLPRSRNIENTKKRIEKIIAERNGKHPVNFPSGGSVFKNPEGHYSWKLVNDAGLKGKKIGGAMVSDMHTNFIINAGDATSREVRELIEMVQEVVLCKYSIKLETEIRMIGAF